MSNIKTDSNKQFRAVQKLIEGIYFSYGYYDTLSDIEKLCDFICILDRRPWIQKTIVINGKLKILTKNRNILVFSTEKHESGNLITNLTSHKIKFREEK